MRFVKHTKRKQVKQFDPEMPKYTLRALRAEWKLAFTVFRAYLVVAIKAVAQTQKATQVVRGAGRARRRNCESKNLKIQKRSLRIASGAGSKLENKRSARGMAAPARKSQLLRTSTAREVHFGCPGSNVATFKHKCMYAK